MDSGTQAMGGIGRIISTNGETNNRTDRLSCKNPIATPSVAPMMNPNPTRRRLAAMSTNNSPERAVDQRLRPTTVGGGNKVEFIAPERDRHSQPTRKHKIIHPMIKLC